MHPLAQAIDNEFEKKNSRSESDQERMRLRTSSGHVHLDMEGIPALHKAKVIEEGDRRVIEKEKSVHRLMAYLFSQGKSNEEVAEITGYTRGQVSVISRQQWCQDLVTYFIHEAGQDQVRKRIEGAGVDSVMKMIALRDGAVSENVQLSASINLLDRLLGKPPQHVEHSPKPPEQPEDEIARIKRELASLDAQQKIKNNTAAGVDVRLDPLAVGIENK